MLTLGEGPHSFDFVLSRTVEERVKIRVKARTHAQAEALLHDHEPELEGWWETYDRSGLEVEKLRVNL
jgi:hypothetical protein